MILLYWEFFWAIFQDQHACTTPTSTGLCQTSATVEISSYDAHIACVVLTRCHSRIATFLKAPGFAQASREVAPRSLDLLTPSMHTLLKHTHVSRELKLLGGNFEPVKPINLEP